MTRFRKNRVAGLLQEAISEIITLKIKDPRVQGVTVTEVKMSGDLKSATVYFSSLADGKAEDHKKGLENAAGYIRRLLREELSLKYIPELSFFYDTAFDNFARINKLLKKIQPKPEDES